MGVGGGEQSCPLTRQEKALERGGRKKQRRDRGFGLNLKLLVCKSPSGAASDMFGHTPQQAKNVHSQAAFFWQNVGLAHKELRKSTNSNVGIVLS